jgi:hypothetical protein
VLADGIKTHVESAHGFSAWGAVQLDGIKTRVESVYGFSAWRAGQVDGIKTHVESAYGVCNQRLKLQHGVPLSKFAFDVNLRRYMKEGGGDGEEGEAGWCRLY